MADSALSGLKVIETGELISAPYCGRLLADLGAEVLKVEPPGSGDAARREGPFPDDLPHPEKSGLFLYLNLNKRGITLDLACATGRAILHRLVVDADVLVDNHPPSAAAALGLDYASLRAVNPRLVVAAVSPFGQTGPRRDYAGTDLIGFHASGFGFEFPNFPEDPEQQRPMKGGGRAADFLAAVTAATGILQALLARGFTGQGQLVDVSVQEAMLAVMYERLNRYNSGKAFSRRRADNSMAALVGVLPCADGYLATSPREDHQWAALMEVIGNPEWSGQDRFATRQSREQNWPAIAEYLGQWTGQRPKEQVYRLFQEKRIPSFPVNTAADLQDNQQLAYREFFADIDHPVAGRLRYPTVPHRATGMPWAAERPAPMLGQHNEEVLCGRLGYNRLDLVRLHQQGVV